MEGFSSSSKGKQEQEKGGELERRSKMNREKTKRGNYFGERTTSPS
jgi:hypothetical protein